MGDSFDLEKLIWIESDFEIMGWHDSRIYAIAFSSEKFELIFDIDYIFKWVDPKPNEVYFSFWISPCTLVFENVYNVEFDFGCNGVELEIDRISCEIKGVPRNAEYIGKNQEWTWTIECQQGEIKFHSTGYQQFVRAKPVLRKQQTLDSKTREISFYRG